MRAENTSSDAFRDGRTVVVSDGGLLPARCIKCNATASGDPIRYTFVDSDAGGAPRGVVTAVVHFGSRRTGQAFISLCARHRRLRALIRWGCPLLLIIGVGIGVYANVRYPKPPEVLVDVTVALTMAGLLPLGIYQQHYLKGRVHSGRVWVSGAGAAFLESLAADRRVA